MRNYFPEPTNSLMQVSYTLFFLSLSLSLFLHFFFLSSSPFFLFFLYFSISFSLLLSHSHSHIFSLSHIFDQLRFHYFLYWRENSLPSSLHHLPSQHFHSSFLNFTTFFPSTLLSQYFSLVSLLLSFPSFRFSIFVSHSLPSTQCSTSFFFIFLPSPFFSFLPSISFSHAFSFLRFSLSSFSFLFFYLTLLPSFLSPSVDRLKVTYVIPVFWEREREQSLNTEQVEQQDEGKGIERELNSGIR